MGSERLKCQLSMKSREGFVLHHQVPDCNRREHAFTKKKSYFMTLVKEGEGDLRMFPLERSNVIFVLLVMEMILIPYLI